MTEDRNDNVQDDKWILFLSLASALLRVIEMEGSDYGEGTYAKTLRRLDTSSACYVRPVKRPI